MVRSKIEPFKFKLVKRFYSLVKSYDLDSEMRFWEDHFAKHFTLGSSIERENAFPQALVPFINQSKQRKNDNLKLLEIGSGPASLLVWGVEENLFEITAMDPLAKQYDKLLAKHGLQYPIKPIEGYAENLLNQFPQKSFDIVYSSNALDHVMSPGKCLENIGLIVKRGGFVCLEGFCREGTHGQWYGLHQHDLVPEKGQLLHFNKKGERSNLTENSRLNCVYEKVVPFHERGIRAFGYEPEETDVISNWHNRDWYTMIFAAL